MEHKVRHEEEIIRDVTQPIDVYLTTLKELTFNMSNDLDNYKSGKLSEQDFCIRLRSLKRATTAVLMKIETGWK